MIGRRQLLAAAAGLCAAPAAAVAEPGTEPALMPALEIVDAHHHMVYRPPSNGQPGSTFLLPDIVQAIAVGGHDVRATVVVEDYGMYRADGPPELRPLGETEYLNGIAAMSASGNFGPCRVGSGIVAHGALQLGDRFTPILEAHQRIAGARLKGVRDSSAWDAYPVMGFALDPARKTVLTSDASKVAMKRLAQAGLTLDTWCFFHQIAEVAAAARGTPNLTFILNHLGSPLAVGPYAGKTAEVFAVWKTGMQAAAATPNMVVKLGGLGMPFTSPTVQNLTPPPSSEALAALWRPYVHTAIDLFGADRCMFESNYPADKGCAAYGLLWNSFKRLASGASPTELRALFSGTARRVYRLDA
jgi:predicted TIM-barrel fold metal-dependent hydrolase